MYDAKEIDNSKSPDYTANLTQGNFIADRSYFQKIQNEKLTNLKSSYVPMDNIINDSNIY